jgi:hypothetical protein
MLATIMIAMIIGLMVFGRMGAIFGEVPEMPEEPDVLVEISIHAALMEMETGEFEDYQGMVELHDSGGYLVEIQYQSEEIRYVSYTLVEGKSYQYWIFPYQNTTYISEKFVAREYDTFMITYLV